MTRKKYPMSGKKEKSCAYTKAKVKRGNAATNVG